MVFSLGYDCLCWMYSNSYINLEAFSIDLSFVWMCTVINVLFIVIANEVQSRNSERHGVKRFAAVKDERNIFGVMTKWATTKQAP